MFHGWPWELLAIPTSEYRRLQRYYFAVKDKENEDSEPPDPGEE